MNLSRVKQIANEICDQYEYPHPSKIILDKRYKYRMAYTHCSKRIIRMNAYLVQHNPEEIIIALLKHEIVHFKYCDHEADFIAEVHRMGSHERVETLFPLINLPFKYIYRCPVCEQNGYGDTRRETSCGDCSTEYDERYKLILVKRNRNIK